MCMHVPPLSRLYRYKLIAAPRLGPRLGLVGDAFHGRRTPSHRWEVPLATPKETKIHRAVSIDSRGRTDEVIQRRPTCERFSWCFAACGWEKAASHTITQISEGFLMRGWRSRGWMKSRSCSAVVWRVNTERHGTM